MYSTETSSNKDEKQLQTHKNTKDKPETKTLYELPTLRIDNNEDLQNRSINENDMGYDVNVNLNSLQRRKSNENEINFDLGVSISSQVCYANKSFKTSRDMLFKHFIRTALYEI